MSDRRKFLKFSMLGAAATFVGKNALASPDHDHYYETVRDEPVVVSTWNFGMEANAAAWEILKDGGHALDAVEAGVKVPEGNPDVSTVGLGGTPDRDGRVTLDSCIMDDKHRCGSVMCLEHIVHAVSVARLVMEKTPHIVLVGDGALQFALENGFKKENLLTPASKKAWQKWLQTSKYEPVNNIENKVPHHKKAPMPGSKTNHDTIGMLAMDANGNLSGACTTSGLAYKIHGRVGDSPVIGAGLYVDNEAGAATATGVGEEVIRAVGAHLIVELMRMGYSPERACKKAVERIIRYNPGEAQKIQVGFLAMNKYGEYGGYSLQPGFSYSVRTRDTNRIFHAPSIYKK
ncbi:MAG: glycosylasparaginase [Bacteroidetes bacterium 46-16]|nr:MAG: glycosylasparaginase [Bacteroidetes bacterium 46-16]